MVQLLTNDSIPSRMWQKQLEICSMDTTSGSVPTLEVRKIQFFANVSFLNVKSVTRVKSVYRVVKWFSMSDPLAPRVDLGCPSLRGPSKIHKWCQWITSGKHFTTRWTDFTRETFYKLRMGLCSILTWITKFLSVFNIVKLTISVHFRSFLVIFRLILDL